jgi:hypothetical protein
MDKIYIGNIDRGKQQYPGAETKGAQQYYNCCNCVIDFLDRNAAYPREIFQHA